MFSRFALLGLLASSVSAQCPAGTFEHVLDFEGFEHGDYVSDLGGGITASSTGNKGLPRVFDTSKTGTLDDDLEVNVGKCLIIQTPDVDEVNDFVGGGFIFFRLNGNPAFADKITVLDAEATGRVTFFDEDGVKMPPFVEIPPIADKEIEVVELDRAGVDTIRVKLVESGAICDLTLCLPCPFKSKPQTFDFSGPSHGDYVGTFGPVTVSTSNVRKGGLRTTNQARIYDSTTINGGADLDLEVDMGNLLIIQEDNSDAYQWVEGDTNGPEGPPDDSEFGGIIRFMFSFVTAIKRIKLVDFENGGKLLAYDAEGDRRWVAAPTTANGGVVDFPVPDRLSKIAGSFDGPKRLDVWISGSGGIAELEICVPLTK